MRSVKFENQDLSSIEVYPLIKSKEVVFIIGMHEDDDSQKRSYEITADDLEMLISDLQKQLEEIR